MIQNDSRPRAQDKDSKNILWFLVFLCFSSKKYQCILGLRIQGLAPTAVGGVNC